MSLTAADAARLVERQGLRVRHHNGGYKTTCPACRKQGRLFIKDAKFANDAKFAKPLLMYCHYGCDFSAILKALDVPDATRNERGKGTFLRNDILLGGANSADVRLASDAKLASWARSNPNGDRLLEAYVARRIAPMRVAAAPLPKRAGRVIRVVHGDLVLLTGLRLTAARLGARYEPGGPRAVPYAVGWAASLKYPGREPEDRGRVGCALRWLHKHGVVIYGGKLQQLKDEAGDARRDDRGDRHRPPRCWRLARVGGAAPALPVDARSGEAVAGTLAQRSGGEPLLHGHDGADVLEAELLDAADDDLAAGGLPTAEGGAPELADVGRKAVGAVGVQVVGALVGHAAKGTPQRFMFASSEKS